MDLTTLAAVQGHNQSDTQLLLATALFAADRHRDQRRKDPKGSPYINHTIEVASRISGPGSSIGPNPPVWILQGALLQSVTDLLNSIAAGIALTRDVSKLAATRWRTPIRRWKSWRRHLGSG